MTSKASLRARVLRRRDDADLQEPSGPSATTRSTSKQPLTRIEAVKARVTTPDPTEISTPKARHDYSSPPSQNRLTLSAPCSSLAPNLAGSEDISATFTTSMTPTSQQPNQPSILDLLSLPSELLLHLTTFLPFNSLLALRSTCHSLYTLLSPTQVTTHRSTITSSLLASERTQLNDYRTAHPRQPYSHLWDLFYAAFEWQLQERPAKELICYGCLETKPLHCFVERMSSRGTGLGGKLAKHRRCKDCMRRFYSIGGAWWREHWVRKSEHKKHRSRMERVGRWVTHGDSLIENVERGEEVGVCACCSGRQSELWWGCKGCFEKEERRKRREDGEIAALLEGGSNEALMKWVIDRSEDWRGRRERKKRRRETRRAEQGRWWRRLYRCTLRRGGVLRWEGSWEGRVEALVEFLQNGTTKDNSSYERLAPVDGDQDGNGKGKEKEGEWRPLDQLPLKKDRREARCSLCWVPTCRRKTFMLGLAYETQLPFERWCGECQKEEVERKEKRRWRSGDSRKSRGKSGFEEKEPDVLLQEEQEVLEGIRGLFV